MAEIKQFNSFPTSFKKINDSLGNGIPKINVEYYHHDFQDEPLLHIEAHLEGVRQDFIEDHGHIISILTKETTIVFTENNYHTNLSNDDVVFSSKNDDETYCIITFI